MVGRRRGPGRTSTRAAAIRTPTPQPDLSDSEMQDAADGATPNADEQATSDAQDEDDEPEAEEDDVTSPAAESDEPTSRTRVARAAVAAGPPVKRKPGRPPKIRPEWDGENGSEAGTPKRRGGFRGRSGFGGGRWRNRGGPSRVSQVPLDKEGNMATVRDDEVELPEDPEGETKVDKLGYLLGGREYRVRTFTIAGRGERLYMLSTEPARCIGFRDSYLFFQKHKQLFKIILLDEEKMDLIERHLIPHSYKGRHIGVVTARSVFREFGAKIVIGGKKVDDDYQAAACIANGDVAGELAVPEDVLPPAGEEYNRNVYVAWHGASSVYHSGAPTVPLQNGKVESKKRKVTVTGVNWMLEHAREASRFNSSLTHSRRQTLDGVYEPHTNALHYPLIMQPTHARWEQLPSPSTSPPSPLAITNGTSTSDPTLFPAISSWQARNLLTIDTLFSTPALPNAPVPGPDGDAMDIGPQGLMAVDDEVAALLPEECRAAFLETRREEEKWRGGWKNQDEDGMKARLGITYSSSLYA